MRKNEKYQNNLEIVFSSKILKQLPEYLAMDAAKLSKRHVGSLEGKDFKYHKQLHCKTAEAPVSPYFETCSSLAGAK